MALRSLALASLLILFSSASHAASILRVDIGRNGQAVEPGFVEFSTPGTVGDAYDPQSFPGGTWDLEVNGLAPFTRNYGDIPTAPLGDLLEDSFLVNTSGIGTYFELVLDDLQPGDYALTTYHHSFDFGGATAEASGGLEGGALTSFGSVTSTTGTDISTFTTLTTPFVTTAGVDGYTLRFTPLNAAGSFHFDLSGFEIDFVPVPEPSAGFLLGLGLVGFVYGRRPRA